MAEIAGARSVAEHLDAALSAYGRAKEFTVQYEDDEPCPDGCVHCDAQHRCGHCKACRAAYGDVGVS